MRTGFVTSVMLHLGVVALVLLMDALVPRARSVEMGVSQVALISGLEFDAAISAAPEAPTAQPEGPQRPGAAPNEDTPAAQPGEAPPTPSDAPPEQAPPQIERPAAPDSAPDEPAELAAATPQLRPLPPAPSPQAAPRSDPRPAAPDRPDTVSAPQPEAAPNASIEPPAPAPDADRAAPQAPARPVVDEKPAARAQESAPKPPPAPTQLAAAPPRRPAAPPPPKPSAPARREASSATNAVEAALAELARREASNPGAGASQAPSGTGRPLSGATRRGLISGIERYFTITPGSVAQRPVRYKVKLTADGRMDGRPEEVQGSGNRGLDIAALRALYDADAAGVFQPLNRRDYNGWPVVLVAFTPEGIVFQ